MNSYFFKIPAIAGILVFFHVAAAPYTSESFDWEGLRRRLNNQETALKTAEQKLESFDSVLEIMREQLESSLSQQNIETKGHSQSMEMRIAALESLSKGLTADLKQLQTHANETATALKSVKQKLNDWDERLKLQNQNIENMQAALQNVLEAFHVKPDQKFHKVKNGESLGTIAKKYGTSIQALKEINGMNSDKIVVDKTIKIPE